MGLALLLALALLLELLLPLLDCAALGLDSELDGLPLAPVLELLPCRLLLLALALGLGLPLFPGEPGLSGLPGFLGVADEEEFSWPPGFWLSAERSLGF